MGCDCGKREETAAEKAECEKSAELELDSMVQSRSSNISGQIEVEYEEER